jgi:uncharacterized protein (TIGR02217 family)
VSNAIYPALAGLGYPVRKVANWATRMQRSVSGRTLRTQDYVNPIWNFTLSYEVLEDTVANPPGQITLTANPLAVRHILNFFNSRSGAFEDFLYNDPKDNQANGQTLIPVPTDTTGTMFQLTRILGYDTGDVDAAEGGFAEWIIAPNVVSAVYCNGQPQSPASYSVDASTGIVTFNAAVAGGITVTADFTYYFRVYFTDSLDADYFAWQLAETKQVRLTSVVL